MFGISAIIKDNTGVGEIGLKDREMRTILGRYVEEVESKVCSTSLYKILHL